MTPNPSCTCAYNNTAAANLRDTYLSQVTALEAKLTEALALVEAGWNEAVDTWVDSDLQGPNGNGWTESRTRAAAERLKLEAK